MPYIDRYEPRVDTKLVDLTPDHWFIYDAHDKRVLMGWYSESSAPRMAKRLNADISLSTGQMRALNTLLSVNALSAHRFYEQFVNRVQPSDATEDGVRIGKQLQAHGLVEIKHEPEGVFIVATDFAYEWSGRAKPEKG